MPQRRTERRLWQVNTMIRVWIFPALTGVAVAVAIWYLATLSQGQASALYQNPVFWIVSFIVVFIVIGVVVLIARECPDEHGGPDDGPEPG